MQPSQSSTPQFTNTHLQRLSARLQITKHSARLSAVRVETDGVIYLKVDHTHSLVLHMRCVCPCNLARTACGNTEDRTQTTNS